MKGSYHITRDAPNQIWPNGAWSVYRIDGDQIASRIVYERVNLEKGYYEGPVIARHSWCGFMSMYETITEAMKAIEGEENLG